MNDLAAGLSALRSRTGLRRTIVAYGLFVMVEFSIWLAILFYAYALGGAPLAAVAAVVQLAPAIALVPYLAGFADRTSRGRALVVSHASVALASLLTAALLAVSAPFPLVIASAAVCTTTIALVRPVHFAALPQLAGGPGELTSANALSSVMDGIGLAAGPALAGLVSQSVGPWLVLAVASPAAAAAAVLCRGLRLPVPTTPTGDDGTPRLASTVSSLLSLGRDWGVVALFLVMGAKFVIEGALDVLGLSYSEVVLGSGATAAGLLIGSVGLGGLLGAAFASTASTRRRLAPLIVAGGLLAGLGLAAVAAIGTLGPVMIVLALVGLGGTLVMVSGRTLLQRTMDDRVLARAFAVQEATSLLGLAIGAAVAPALLRWVSTDGAFVVLGLGMSLVTLGVIGLIRRLDERASYLPEEIGLLRGISFLSVLPSYDIERLARRARWLTLAPGEVVIRQGDVGVAFYIIAAGRFTVAVNDVNVPGLGPGAGFGEVALLFSIPRTATVVSSTDARVLQLKSADFLAAVTGSVEGREIAAEVAVSYLARNLSDGPA